MVQLKQEEYESRARASLPKSRAEVQEGFWQYVNGRKRGWRDWTHAMAFEGDGTIVWHWGTAADAAAYARSARGVVIPASEVPGWEHVDHRIAERVVRIDVNYHLRTPRLPESRPTIKGFQTTTHVTRRVELEEAWFGDLADFGERPKD